VNRIRGAVERVMQAWGGAGELVADAHAYGGALLVAAGAERATEVPGVGMIAFGLLLLVLYFRSRPLPPRRR
jgi:hypothetical protein